MMFSCFLIYCFSYYIFLFFPSLLLLYFFKLITFLLYFHFKNLFIILTSLLNYFSLYFLCYYFHIHIHVFHFSRHLHSRFIRILQSPWSIYSYLQMLVQYPVAPMVRNCVPPLLPIFVSLSQFSQTTSNSVFPHYYHNPLGLSP